MSEYTVVESINHAVVVSDEPQCQDGSPIEALILNFVKEKAARSQSEKTAKAYFDTVAGFRAYLQEQGYEKPGQMSIDSHGLYSPEQNRLFLTGFKLRYGWER